MPRHARLAASIAVALTLASVDRGYGQSPWVELAWKEAGLVVQMPATPTVNPKNAGRYSTVLEESTFIVEFEPLGNAEFLVVAKNDRKTLAAMLDAGRDAMAEGLKGKAFDSSSADFDGYPSIVFSLEGELESRSFIGRERVVYTEAGMYTIATLGTKGKLPQADIDRFFASFRIVRPDPAARDAMRTIRFTDLVCDKIPALPLQFAVPADFEPRLIAAIEGGCLWGTKDDIDRALVNPDEGDFSALRRGIFRARVSTNVVWASGTGMFDSLDGSGEEGLRRQLVAGGGKVIVFKKETIAGFPVLQIVANYGPGRVYMLYLGNTQFISNAMLVNYYHPTRQSPADDALWARFIAGITKAR
jgi:hypothetical protein